MSEARRRLPTGTGAQEITAPTTIGTDDTAVADVAEILRAAALCRELLGAVDIDTSTRSASSRRPAGSRHGSRRDSVCVMADVLAVCLSDVAGSICISCTELEIGETLPALRARANAATHGGARRKWRLLA
jgi:hypothetical protein